MNDVLIHSDSILGEEFLASGKSNPINEWDNYSIEEWDDLSAEGEGRNSYFAAHGKLFKKIGSALKKDINKAESGLKKDIKKAEDVAEDVIKLSLRYQPLLILMRNGFLAAVRLNVGGLATRLMPAVIPESDAINKYKYKSTYIPQAKANYAKVKHLFVNDLQGKDSNLERDIKKGYRNTPFSLKTILKKGGGKKYEEKYRNINADGEIIGKNLYDPNGALINPVMFYNDAGTNSKDVTTGVAGLGTATTAVGVGIGVAAGATAGAPVTIGAIGTIITALAPIIKALGFTNSPDGKAPKISDDANLNKLNIENDLPDGSDVEDLAIQAINNNPDLTPDQKHTAIADYKKSAKNKQSGATSNAGGSGLLKNKWVWIIGGVALLGIVILIIPKKK